MKKLPVIYFLKRSLKSGIVCLLFTLVISFFSKEQLTPLAIFYGFTLGCVVGALESTLFQSRFNQIIFPLLVFLKGLIYLLIVIGIILIIGLQQVLTNDLSSGELFNFIFSTQLIPIFLQSLIIILFVLLVFHIESFVGNGVMTAYMFGKYHRPKLEDRIFMFLDMKNSTTIAEELGDKRYYSFLNTALSDMSKAIFRTEAEIYKYVGDEVILTWQIKPGIRNNNCIQLYFLIEEELKKKKNWYISKYGVFPEFKAGLHSGKVVTAQIGDLKKEIAYNGDVLNTTARIQGLCNQHKSGLLVSERIKQIIPQKEQYNFDDIGFVELKGKTTKLHLFSTSQR